MNNINKLLSLNEDFNFNDFSKKVSNKDIVKIIKENNRQNYIIEKFDKDVNIDQLGVKQLDFKYIQCGKFTYYPEDFKNKKYWAYSTKNYIYFDAFKEIKIFLDKLPDNCSKLFSWNNFYYLDLSHINTSNIINMAGMFRDCHKLEEIILKNFNTSNVTNMCCMFNSCYNLEKLDLSSFNTSKVIDMGLMFYNCKKLKEVNLSSFNTSKLDLPNGLEDIFSECYTLGEYKLELYNWLAAGGTYSNLQYPYK